MKYFFKEKIIASTACGAIFRFLLRPIRRTVPELLEIITRRFKSHNVIKILECTFFIIRLATRGKDEWKKKVFKFCFFKTLELLRRINIYFFRIFFAKDTNFTALRVAAFVRVRWPLHGKLSTWRLPQYDRISTNFEILEFILRIKRTFNQTYGSINRISNLYLYVFKKYVWNGRAKPKRVVIINALYAPIP